MIVVNFEVKCKKCKTDNFEIDNIASEKSFIPNFYEDGNVGLGLTSLLIVL